VLAVALVASIVVGAVQWRRADRLATTESIRTGAAATADAFGIALFTYDYTDVGGAAAAVLKLATPHFALDYRASLANGLAASITRLHATSSATVRDSYVANVAGDRAGAFVIVDTRLVDPTGTREASDYLELTLLRQAGQWRVDAVMDVGSSSPSP